MAERLFRPPVLRRLPDGWMGYHDGQAWPVRDPGSAADAAGATWFFTGEALLVEPPEGEFCALPARPAPPPLPSLPMPHRAAAAPVLPGMRLGAHVVPRAALWRLVPMPAVTPLPFAPPGVMGLAVAQGFAALVLHGAADAPLLALLSVQGRMLGLPCMDARPDADAGTLDILPAAALALAPPLPEARPAPPTPATALVLSDAGGITFALPALAIDAVLPPMLPAPPPGDAGGRIRGVVSHRGQVLPVVDGGQALGGPPALGFEPVPLLRLGAVAVAVALVRGLRRVPEAALTARGAGPVIATAWPDGAAVPVIDPAFLARLS